MGIESALAGALSNQGSQLGETVVQGLGTLLGGLDSIINPGFSVPPFIGMASSDFMNMGVAAIMASTNTNLQFAKQQAQEQGFTDLLADVADAERARQRCAINHGAKARIEAAKRVTEKPTEAEIKDFYAYSKKIVAIKNTQNVQLKVYKEYLERDIDPNFDFRALLRKIIKGAGKVFTYTDKAKKIYEKAKPYLEKI